MRAGSYAPSLLTSFERGGMRHEVTSGLSDVDHRRRVLLRCPCRLFSSGCMVIDHLLRELLSLSATQMFQSESARLDSISNLFPTAAVSTNWTVASSPAGLTCR